ncbi:MAG TPA: hypothetical protein PLV45_11650 [bacterium]|nr:hypothetical protein [bacterium]
MIRLSRTQLRYLLILTALVVFLSGVRPFWFYTVEDAYISFRYCDNMLAGRGLVFNPGEPVEGYTNFLWIMLISVPRRVLPFPLAAKIPGLLLGTLLISMLGFSRNRNSSEDLSGPLAALLVAASPGIRMWSVAGLETVLFTVCILGAWMAATVRSDRTGRLMSGVMFGLATLTRPDGLLLFALFIIAHRGFGRCTWRQIPEYIAGFCLLVVPHQIFRLFYYHAWIPNTFWVKTRRFADGGTAYFLRYAAMTGAFSLPVALAGLWNRRGRSDTGSLTVMACGYLAYVYHVGGDWMAYGRFLIPAIPLLALAGARVVFITRHNSFRRIAIALMILSLCISAVSARYDLLRFRPTRYYGILTWEHRHTSEWTRVALWMKEAMPPDTVLCTGLAGVIPYYSELPVIDRGGLNDREIASIVYHADSMEAEEKAIESVLLERRPDIIMIESRSFQMVTDQPAIPETPPWHTDALTRLYRAEVVRLNGGYFAFYRLNL